MGYMAVLLAALGGFVMGGVWYMALSKPWITAAGVACDEKGRPEGSGSPLPFVISGICMLLVAGMMRHIFTMAGIDGVAKSALSGFGIGLFFIAPWVAMNNGYAMRPRALSLIDGGYAVTGCTVIGLILGLF